MSDPRALHLLRRATYGPTPAALAEVTRQGPDAWLEGQLAPSSIGDPHAGLIVRRFPALGWSIARVRAAHVADFGSWSVMLQLSQATLARAIWSRRQLFELMVEFWSNHLNVTNPSSDVWDNRAHYDRVIRRHALGSFSELLVAATVHPAMQRYLDNASSDREHPNENHGRELLELHTLGADALYAADDPEAAVRNSALILTGLGVDDDTGEPVYRPERHHVGRVQVLGFSHPNASADGGRAVAAEYLRYLAQHPATAAAIARKLAVRFVSDDPPQALVERLAATYTAAGTAITPVLRELFGSAEFAAAEGKKLRRPYEDLVATVRVLGLLPDAKGTRGVQALHWTLADLGQAPLAWNPPNGYPDVAPAWQSAAGTLNRWNAHLNIAARWWPATLRGPALTALLPPTRPGTHGDLVDALARRLLHRTLPVGQRQAICTFLDAAPDTPLHRDSAAIGWRLPYVVALILDSPLFALR